VVWGALHALYYLVQNITHKTLKLNFENSNWNTINFFRVIYNFTIVTIAWVFFRSENFEKAIDIFKSLFAFSLDKVDIVIPYTIVALLTIFIVSDIGLYKHRFDIWVSKRPFWLRWFIYAFLIFCITGLAGVNDNPFIYFQF
jgi:D-alanyl-lipoteichoic acid acyltransferase DltB (MBOAT superfamily)